MYQSFLIKYAEIAIKGKNRHLFEDALVSQICHALREVDGEFNVRKEQGRIYVEAESEFDYEETVEALQHVFGIVGICPVIMAQDEGFDALAQMVVAHVKEVYGDKSLTFKVDARRARKNYPMTSMEINAELGGRILDACPNMSVDVHDPDVMVHVEIRNQINIYSSEIPGPGGMPVGTNGRAMLLLSGGIDSPVAGYRMARRGVHISAIHYVSPPYTSDRAQEKVEQLCQELTPYCGNIAFFCVPFTEIQEAIKKYCPEEYFTVIMRRLMMEIAQKIAAKDNCLALITGESVGQVASQTMQAIACTDAVSKIPVFRPLIGSDKTEIVETARAIGTFETSTLPYEDCCTVFTPKHPKVRPSLEEVEKAQAKFDFTEMVDKAVAGTTMKVFELN